MGKRDLLEECIQDVDQKRDYKAFQDTFCVRCRNTACVHAGWAQDHFGRRTSEQVERIFSPHRGDPKSSQYEHLQDFPDKTAHAIRADTADRKGDWEVPEVPVVDGRQEVAPHRTTQAVDRATRSLAEARGNGAVEPPEPESPQPDPFLQETVALMGEEDDEGSCEQPDTPTPKQPDGPLHRSPIVAPAVGNTSVPKGGIMIGGGQARAIPADDPWAPPSKDKVVQPGAQIQMGGDSGTEDSDG